MYMHAMHDTLSIMHAGMIPKVSCHATPHYGWMDAFFIICHSKFFVIVFRTLYLKTNNLLFPRYYKLKNSLTIQVKKAMQSSMS